MEKKTILIIDDAPEVRRILKFHLEEKYKILEAEDGEEGLRLAYEQHPDLLILDINLPKVGGIAVLAKLSERTGKPAFPVIILTTREELGPLFKDLDVDGFITKPFEIGHIKKEIDLTMLKRYGIPAAGVSTAGVRFGTLPVKVLVIDDDIAAFNKIVVTFIDAGYQASIAESGMQAIEKIQADPPDLILVKLEIKDIPGDIICAKLKQMAKTKDIPSVLYSMDASHLDGVMVDKLCALINTPLVKTNEAAVLLNEVRRVLDNRNIQQGGKH